ncbi:MAG TPA: hypothetical protein ENO14_05540 [Chromatiales bacterium]|nr:hypothetical protein [Chromatiales bacterium]
MEMKVTGSEVLDVVSAAGELAWARCQAIEDDLAMTRPPLMMWRFKQVDRRVEETIAAAIASFRGTTEWTFYFTGKNWVLLPSVVKAALDRSSHAMQELERLARERPEVGIAANSDLPSLAEHIRRALSGPAA